MKMKIDAAPPKHQLNREAWASVGPKLMSKSPCISTPTLSRLAEEEKMSLLVEREVVGKKSEQDFVEGHENSSAKTREARLAALSQITKNLLNNPILNNGSS